MAVTAHAPGETELAPALPTLISRPRQIAQGASISRNGHNTLRDQMNLTATEFSEFVVCLRPVMVPRVHTPDFVQDVIDESTELNLDVSLPWKQQTREAKAAHISWVCDTG